MAMNLGAETLRQVTASRPELVHSSSQQSIAASDDFYSMSERGVSPTSSDEATTVIRHLSPEQQRTLVSPLSSSRERSPSQLSQSATQDQSSDVFYPSRSTPSPAPPNGVEPEQERVRQTTPSIRHVSEEPGSGAPTPRPTTIVRAASTSRPTTRHTVVHDSSAMPSQPTVAVTSHPEGRPSEPAPAAGAGGGSSRPTDGLGISAANTGHNRAQPGTSRSFGAAAVVDANNSPYLRQYNPHATPEPDNTRLHPSWEWQTSKVGNPVPTPGVDPSPELRFAIDQITRDEEISGVGRDSIIATGASSQYSEHLEDRHVSAGEAPAVSRGSGASGTPFIRRDSAGPRISNSTEPNRARVSNRYSLASVEESNDYRKLRAVPPPLRGPQMLGLLLLCVIAVILLVYSSVHSALSEGLTRYDGTGTSLYFVYKYLPQLFAAAIIIWLHVIQDAIQRILPFVLLIPRSRNYTEHDILQTTKRFKTSYLLPDFSLFRDGEFGLGVCSVIFWMTLFTVPIAATLYTPTYFRFEGGAHWRWNTVQAVCWTLLSLYSLLILALVFVAFRFNLQPTSLFWDPVSLADIFVLLRRGNTTISRYSADSGKFAGRPDTRPVSLGLWRSPSNANGLSHGLGVDVENTALPYSPPPAYDTMNPSDPNSPYPVSHFDSWQTNRTDGQPWLPWFLRPSPAALWIAIAMALMIAFLVVSWVNRAVQDGFDPLLFAGSRGGLNFSSANFLYSFLPALLGMLCYLFWQPIDASFRALQPFAEMQKEDSEHGEGGALAERSVLLDYNARPPLVVSLVAAKNGHFRVAWTSFVTTMSIVIPVLAGGVFEAQYVVGTVDTIHEIASIPGYIALCVFVIVYALSYLVIWPTKAHRLPHSINTISDVADFVIGGKMLNDIVWRNPQTKTILVTNLVVQKRLTGEKLEGMGNFRFGEHLGLDGKRRLGIYRAS